MTQRKMKRKNLNNQISRIHEIMGTNKKPLLMEQAWVDDLIQSLVSAGVKEESTLMKLGRKLETGLADDGVTALTTKQRAETIDKMVAAARATKDDAIISVINNKLIKNIPQTTLDTIKTMTKSADSISQLKNAVNNGATDDDIVNTIANNFNPNTGDDVLDEVIRNNVRRQVKAELKTIRQSLDDVASSAGKTADDVASDTGKVADDVTGEVDDISNAADELTPEELASQGSEGIADLDDAINTWGPDIVGVTEAQAMDILEVAKSQEGLWAWVTRNTATVEKRIERIKKLSQVLTKTEDSQLRANLQKQIQKDTYKLGVEGVEFAQGINEYLKLVIAKFPTDRGIIIDPKQRLFADFFKDISTKSDGFTNIEKMLQLSSKEGNKSLMIISDAWKNAWKGTDILTTIKNVGKSGKDLVKKSLGVSVDDAAKETAEKILKSRNSTFNWLRSGSVRGNPWFPSNVENYLEIITKVGSKSAATKSYLLELFFRLIKWKMVFAFLYTFRNAVAASPLFTNEDEKAKMKNCLSLRSKSGATPEEINNACSEFNNDLIAKWAMDSVEGNLSDNDQGIRLTKDLFDQMFGQSWGDEISDYFPGKLDDLVNSVWSVWVGLGNDIELEQIEETLRNGEQQALDQIDNTQDELDDALLIEEDIPQDLKDIMGEKSNQIKRKTDGTLYWGDESYIIKKIDNQWQVWWPEDGWYLVSEMEL